MDRRSIHEPGPPRYFITVTMRLGFELKPM